MALTTIDDRGLKTPIDLFDNEKIRFGTSQDAEIYHSGSSTVLSNVTGFLFIQSQDLALRATSGENYIVCDADQEVELYYDGTKKFETTSTGVKITGTRTDIDTGGTEDCLRIGNADGCDTAIRLGSTGTNPDTHAVIKYDKDDNWLSLLVSGEAHGSGGLLIENGGNVRLDDAIPHSDNTRDLGTSAIRWRDIYVSNDIDIEDNGKLILGDGDDVQIYHDGNDTYFDNNVGDFYIRNDGNSTSEKVRIQAKGGEQSILCSPNGAVELYHDNSKKFETTSTGSKVTGADLTVIGTEGISAGLYLIADEGDDNGDGWRINSNQDANDLTFANNTSGSYVDKLTLENDGDLFTTGDVYLQNDSKKLKLGASDDLQIYHDGSNSYIKNATGDLIVRGGGDDILLQAVNGEQGVKIIPNGAVEVYHDNSKKLETTADGIFVKNSIKIEESSGSEYYLIATNSYGGLEFQNETTKIAEFTDANTLELQDNLKFAVAGKGIDFSITGDGTGSMSSELLDDYEEGSWTPACNKSGAGFSGTVTVNAATYVKVGQLVHIQAYISFSNDSDSSHLYITQLPFTIGGTSSHYSQMSVQTNADVADPILRAQGNSTELRGKKFDSGDGDISMTYTNVKDHWLIFGGTYRST